MNRPERAVVGRAGYLVSLWGQWIFLCVGAFALMNPAIGQGVQPSQDELKALGGYSDKEVIAEPLEEMKKMSSNPRWLIRWSIFLSKSAMQPQPPD